MTKTILGAVAALAIAGTAVPASAMSNREFCTILADDAAYIMGVRQRGEKMTGVLDAMNWRKYSDTPLEDLPIELASLAWYEPIGRSAHQRRQIISSFAQDAYSACMKSFGRF